MTVCSFLGHQDVFDADIEIRLQAAVDEVVRENETVEFWLCPDKAFFNCCLLAVLRAKKQNPQKIGICLVADEYDYRKLMRQEPGSVPACMFDKVILCRNDDGKSSNDTMPYKTLLRHVVQKSTYVITYLYPRLYEAENHILSFAVKNPKIRILSVTSLETERAIIENAAKLSEKEQRIFHKMNERCTLKEAGASLGVGQERARQILRQGCRTIRCNLELQFSKESTRIGNTNRACGIFALDRENYKLMKRFKHIVDFLAAAFRVKRFYIEQPYANSGYMIALKEWQPPFRTFRITAVTDEEMFSEQNRDDDLNTRFCPPCDAVSCVSWPDAEYHAAGLHIIADIIGRSDFCISNLSAIAQIEKLQQYICQQKQTIFLDIGKADIVSGNETTPGIVQDKYFIGQGAH